VLSKVVARIDLSPAEEAVGEHHPDARARCQWVAGTGGQQGMIRVKAAGRGHRAKVQYQVGYRGFSRETALGVRGSSGQAIGDASPRPWDARFRQFFDGLPAPVSGRDFSMSGIFRTAPTETTSIRGFSRDSWLTFKFLRATFVETINAAWSWPLSFSNRGRRSPRRSKIRCDNERSGRERVCLFQPMPIGAKSRHSKC